MTERLEFKAAFTVVDDSGAIEGKAWDFTSADRVGDVIEPAAFIGAVGKSVPMLFAHDQAQAVGVWDSVTVEADGLKVKGKLLVDEVARAKEVRGLVKAGAVTGLSVGFMTKKAAPRKGGGRTISDLDLVEVSIVAVPAHPGAQVSSVKELEMTTAATAENKTTETEVKAADLKAANDNIAALTKRLEEAETKLARPNVITDKKAEPTDEAKAFDAYLRHGKEAGVEELKALTVSSDPAGGYLAPAEFSAEFVRNLVQYSPIRQYASVRSTGSPSVIYPARTSVTNAKWKGETQTQEGSEPAFGQAEIPVNELNTFVDISNQLLADSAGVAEAEVRLALAEDFGQKEGQAFLTGTGASMPMGLLKDPNITVGKTTASATAIAPDELIDLYFSLPALYRQNGVWGMNTKTLAAVRKLKDGQGAYLYQSPQTVGEPASLLGRPIAELLEMDDIATGKDSVIFGDFSGYRIVDRLSMSILANPYLLATNGITRFHATRRVGAAVLQPAKFKKLRQA
ncbi:phage major capsid protein [Rhizobium leguminosarum]|uniref:phage major capsid protein n=1 Tax=Rhizobium leguminosarum TaxID=384 RepID=UPI001AE16E1A|nr:phage major capsid protein [Rhizobium leguminosarum]MBP2445943.1 HK97 family phage major capsid protein/HK97 family phage prohead protease [Rhizobium leguminosarum]